MAAVPADLSIACRWILPMTARGEVLENHALIVRDGRILDLLPSAVAAERYAAAAHLDRSQHLLLPGLVNAYTCIAPAAGGPLDPQQLHDGALLCIAEMLRAGTTCFCSTGYFPEESARSAAAQGLRAVIGIPIGESPSAWAASLPEYLTRALNFRDEYRGHPNITTAFAPQAPAAIGDAAFARIATLADELEAGILIALHESRAAVEASRALHGLRPIERLQALGLLTPALTAVHMVDVNAADLSLAQRGGIAIVFCPESNLRSGFGAAPATAWAQTGLRLGVGGGAATPAAMDLWSQLRLLALLSQWDTNGTGLDAWDALAAATRGGAAALGLDAEIGTLEAGKWADLCCVDLRSPAMYRAAAPAASTPLTALVFNGIRDLVSDVWVAGRHLLSGGTFTRLDWAPLAARVSAWPASAATGG